MAAKHGNLEVMKWLKNKCCPWNKNTFIKAAENGSLTNMTMVI